MGGEGMEGRRGRGGEGDDCLVPAAGASVPRGTTQTPHHKERAGLVQLARHLTSSTTREAFTISTCTWCILWEGEGGVGREGEGREGGGGGEGRGTEREGEGEGRGGGE